MSSSLKYTLLDSQLNQNPIILHKNERKPMLQTRKINNGKSMLTLKSEQLTELFLVPFSETVENGNDDRYEYPLQCVCSGHCQNGSNCETSGGDIEMVCLDNNHHAQHQHTPKNNVNNNQNEQAYQKLKLNQDRLRLQNQQMKNLQKLGDFHGLANMLRVDTRTGLSNYNQSDLGHRIKLEKGKARFNASNENVVFQRR